MNDKGGGLLDDDVQTFPPIVLTDAVAPNERKSPEYEVGSDYISALLRLSDI